MPPKVDLQRIIDLSPAMHYVAEASADYATLYLSDGVRAQLGYSPAQFIEDPGFWIERIHPEDRQRVLADLGAVFDSGRHVHEYRFLHADGSWRWMRDELVLVRNDRGEPEEIVGSWLDITSRREVEDAYAKALARLEEAQRMAGIGSWELDVAAERPWWSAEIYRILGEDPHTFQPSRAALFEKVHPDDRQRFTEIVDQARRDGKPYSLDYRVVLSDGTEKVLHGRGYSTRSEAGLPTRFAGTVQDVTERERTAQALRRAEARNRALLESNPDVIFRIDVHGRYLDLSVPASKPFPFTREQFIGSTVADLFGERFAEEHRRYVRAAIETGETMFWQTRVPLPGGEDDVVEARFVRSGDNEAVVTVRDVTERLALQREIVAAQERERSRIGHDLHDGLGQELTGISLGLEALVQKLAGEGSPHVRTVHHLKSMTQKSISVTRRLARSLSPGFGGGFGLAEALELLASEVSEHANVTCTIRRSAHAHAHGLEVETNLYRIAQEGVTNALKHGRPKSIELSYGCDGTTTRLTVIDDGTGIPPERRRAEGMGLRGMRYRAQLVNGGLELAATAGGGTQVLCYCPCHR